MIKIQPIFIESLISLTHYVSKDETRPHFQGIHISYKDDQFVLEATNGHVLKQIKLDINDVSIDNKNDKEELKDLDIIVLINRAALKRFIKDTTFISIEFSDRGLKMQYLDNVISWPSVEIKYPNTNSITSISYETTQLAISVDELKRILDDYKSKNNQVIIHIPKDLRFNKAIKVSKTLNCNDITIIMPRRIN